MEDALKNKARPRQHGHHHLTSMDKLRSLQEQLKAWELLRDTATAECEKLREELERRTAESQAYKKPQVILRHSLSMGGA